MNTEKDTQMRDEELYALLDSVMEDERLTVREELIQATLQRVKSEEKAEVILMKKSGGKKYRMLSYAGMAAAAVLVVFVGIKTINNGGFSGSNMKAESVADGLLYEKNNGSFLTDSTESVKSESESGGKKNWYYSVADNADGAELQEPSDMEADAICPEEVPERGGEVKLCSRVKLSAELQEAVSGTDNAEAVIWAECWILQPREGNWQEEMKKRLEACTVEKELPEEGEYNYALCRDDGTVKNIAVETPLDLVVRIETESGELWGFFGENVRVCRME